MIAPAEKAIRPITKEPRMKTLIALTLAALALGSAHAQQQKTVLGIDTAKKIAAACEARAKQEGWNMVIAVVDDGGHLKHFSRMDNSFRKSIEIALLKAETSSGFPRSSRQMADVARQRAPGIEHVPGIVIFGGGLPILTGRNEHIGAIGVSGGTPEQDEQCAQAGLDAVKGELGLK